MTKLRKAAKRALEALEFYGDPIETAIPILRAALAEPDEIAAAVAAEREACAKLCDDYSDDRWAAYKGQPPYEPVNPARADRFEGGASAGADDCAVAIRKRGEKL